MFVSSSSVCLNGWMNLWPCPFITGHGMPRSHEIHWKTFFRLEEKRTDASWLLCNNGIALWFFLTFFSFNLPAIFVPNWIQMSSVWFNVFAIRFVLFTLAGSHLKKKISVKTGNFRPQKDGSMKIIPIFCLLFSMFIFCFNLLFWNLEHFAWNVKFSSDDNFICTLKYQWNNWIKLNLFWIDFC